MKDRKRSYNIYLIGVPGIKKIGIMRRADFILLFLIEI